MSTTEILPPRTPGPQETYAFEQRRLASEASSARLRMTGPSLIYPGFVDSARTTYLGPMARFVYVWRKGRSWCMSDLHQSDPAEIEDLNVVKVAETILPRVVTDEDEGREITRGGVLVVPDRRTAEALAALAHKREQYGLARLIMVAAAMNPSSRVVVLTEALGRKFWLPQERDESDLSSYSLALGIGRRRHLSQVRRMLLACYRPDHDLDDADLDPSLADLTPSVLSSQAHSETILASLARYSGPEAESSRFMGVTRIRETWAFVESMDLGLRELARMDGSVFQISAIPGARGLVDVAGTFRAREGKRILACPRRAGDPVLGSPARVDAVEADPAKGTYRLRLTEPKPRRGVTSVPLLDQLEQRGTLDVTVEPFLPGFTGRPGRRWTNQTGSPEGPPDLRREVPAILAAAAAS